MARDYSFPAGEVTEQKWETQIPDVCRSHRCFSGWQNQKTTRAPQRIGAVAAHDQRADRLSMLGLIWAVSGKRLDVTGAGPHVHQAVGPEFSHDPFASRSPHGQALLHPSVCILLLHHLLLLRTSGRTHASD